MELGGLKITDCSDVLVKQREISSLSLIAVNKFWWNSYFLSLDESFYSEWTREGESCGMDLVI